ncbi:unnamed protein product [Kuraishia capsulata CBS 1993]|uniref:TBP-associated factor 12 n=1 Tax=Kuraishia capsulata CBS 1993 TaxID=1382522 RepID=W6MQI4_9ASCO|nr:uncharacterized protein KUCA_T00000115001 [Kuraishia capsulata CBS 1993]CDK24155.1 unnamed protein product [Kuraishia capsulata CBS 1993]
MMPNQQSQQGQSQPRHMSIQPAQAQQLAKQFEYELNAAKQAGLQTPAGRQHSQKAESIKSILIEYKKTLQLQRQQMQQQQSSQGVVPSPQMGDTRAGIQSQNQPSGNTPIAANQQQQQSQTKQQLAMAVQKFQEARKFLERIQAQLRTVAAAQSNANITDQERQALAQKEVALNVSFNQARNIATQLSQQIQQLRPQIPNLDQNAKMKSQSPVVGSPSIAQTATVAGGSGQSAQNPNAAAMAQKRAIGNQQYPPNLTPQQQAQLQQMRLMQQQKAQQAAGAAQQAQIRPQQQVSQGQQFSHQQQQQQQQQAQQQQAQRSMSQTPMPQRSQTPGVPAAMGGMQQPSGPATGASQAPGTPVTMVNAAARPGAMGAVHPTAGQLGANITKPVVPTNPITEDLKVELPKPVSTKQNNRPSILGGTAVNAPALTTPTLVRPPVFEMEGDRVLHKRKLKELVRSVGADEGDGEVVIDGDVEELLLDLADEFVTSVTGFACRLAKHRKADTIDVKDIQLHLERNWNIRIPGHSSDDIRSIRKWNPTTAYNQKIAGLNLSRSVNKN